ncbi:MAG: hypothetical protein D3M94_04810 [Rhodocyclales bacterium GT-UBC]|nr:MAG: hypothetical protein D3M94_04810 [Rhodocyclales bacterium GT-UBC]
MFNKAIIAGITTLFVVASSLAAEQQALPAGAKSFLMIPVTEPTDYQIRNFNYTPPASYQRRTLNQIIKKIDPKLGDQLQKHIAAKLANAGLTEISGADIRVNPDNPGKIDYKSIKQNADVIIHVYLDGLGVISTSTSIGATQYQNEYSNYVPFVFVSYCILVPQRGSGCQLESSGVYGNRTAQDAKLEYRSNPREIWGSFADIEASPQSVIDAIANGAIKLGDDIVDEIVGLK